MGGGQSAHLGEQEPGESSGSAPPRPPLSDGDRDTILAPRHTCYQSNRRRGVEFITENCEDEGAK
jgi:hypothetical protein